MLPCEDKHYLVVTRDDLSAWVEVRALIAKKAQHVAKFFWKYVICRYFIFGRFLVDGRGENNAETIEQGKEQFDPKKRRRAKELEQGMLALLYDGGLLN